MCRRANQTSGHQLRLPPPPDQAATAAELQELRALEKLRDGATPRQHRVLGHRSAGYRWNGILADELSKHNLTRATTSRQAALMQVPIYDATIAAWDSKYTYRRPRPSPADPTLVTPSPHRRVPPIPRNTLRWRRSRRESWPTSSPTTAKPS